jgi:hypothetical protein
MLICKGTRVVLDLRSGKTVRCPPSWGMCHDPDGKDWPKDSVLILPYRRTGQSVDYGPARTYFGPGYDVESGEPSGSLPPKDLRAWKRVGHVGRKDGEPSLWYTRPGTSHPGPFKHKLNDGWFTWILGKRRAILYRRRGAYLLDFPDGVIADARGFVHP